MLIRRLLGRNNALSGLLIFIVICGLFAVYKSLNKWSSSLSEESETKRRFRKKLIIVILSGPRNLEQREAARQTWLSESYEGVKHAFVVGLAGATTEERERLILENKSRKDLLLLPNFQDSYNALTQKVLQTFVHLYKEFQFDYILKCDDDSFVLIDKVLKELERLQDRYLGKELYWGFFNGKAQVKKTGPWRESEWIFCDFYLPYALGGGYILSYNLVKFIAQNSLILKYVAMWWLKMFVTLYIPNSSSFSSRSYNSEDVSVGLWLAPLANIERKHDVRFDTEYRSRGCSNEYIITHKQSVESMNSMYQTYKATGALCLREIRRRNSYIYDWHVPPSKCCTRQPGIP